MGGVERLCCALRRPRSEPGGLADTGLDQRAAAEARGAESFRTFLPDGGRGRGQVPRRGLSRGAARRLRALRRHRRSDSARRAEILECRFAGSLLLSRSGAAAPFSGTVDAIAYLLCHIFGRKTGFHFS